MAGKHAASTILSRDRRGLNSSPLHTECQKPTTNVHCHFSSHRKEFEAFKSKILYCVVQVFNTILNDMVTF